MSEKEKSFQEDLIIDRPSTLGVPEQITRMSITLFFWLCLFYIWQPLISMVAWVFKIKLFYDHMIILGGYRAFIATALIYLSVVCVLGGALILWAKIQQWRFSGVERRSEMPRLTQDQLADYYHVPSQFLIEWQTYKNATVYFDGHHQFESVEENQTEGSETESERVSERASKEASEKQML